MNTLPLLSLALAIAYPSDPPPRAVESIFPADSFAVAGFAGLDACKLAAAQVGWSDLADRSAQRFGGGRLVELASRGLPQLDSELARLGIDRATLRAVLAQPVAIGLGRPTLVGDEPMPSFAVAFDARGAARSASQRVLDAVVRVAGLELPRSDARELEIAGASCRVIEDPRGRAPTVVAGFVGDFAVVSNSPGYFGAIARTWGDPEHAFVAIPDVGGAMRNAQAGQLLWGHMRLSAFSKILQDVIPYEVEDIASAIGVCGLDGLYLGEAVGEFGSTDELRLLGAGMDTGLIGAALPGGITARAARYLPLETLLIATHVHDFRRIVGAASSLFEVLPAEARRELERDPARELERGLGRLGLDLQTFIGMVESLGPEVTFAVGTPSLREGLLPAAMAFIDCRGDGELGRRLANALVAAGVEPRTQDFDGMTITYVPVDADEIRIAPAFVEHDGMLVAASDLRALKRALRRAAKPGDRLSDDVDFVATLARHADASALWCVRLRHNLGGIYEALMPRLEGVLEQNEVGIHAEDLPTVDELRAALGDVVFSLAGGQQGLTLRSESPIGYGAFLAVGGAVVDELLANSKSAPRRVN